MMTRIHSVHRVRLADRVAGFHRLLACAVVITGCAVVPAAGAVGQAAEPVRLRVLSYNIHHAEGIDGKLDLERIARVIAAVKPDLVALQEVDKTVTRTGRVDQAAELARLTEMRVTFGGNIELQGGQYGNAVLSRRAVAKPRNHALPNTTNGEQRGVLDVDISLPGGSTVRFLATHFDHRSDDTDRVKSARLINQLVADEHRPAILAGDLNDVIGSATLKELEANWQRTSKNALPTIPVENPARQIDFVLVRPANRWRIVETQVLDEAVASDHRAILCVLELQPADGNAR